MNVRIFIKKKSFLYCKNGYSIYRIEGEAEGVFFRSLLSSSQGGRKTFFPLLVSDIWRKLMTGMSLVFIFFYSFERNKKGTKKNSFFHLKFELLSFTTCSYQ